MTDVSPLIRLMQDSTTVVLSGAGVSTESGIPDYRGPETRRKSRNPIQYRAFVQDAGARRHYWARSAIGWPSFQSARPNAGHAALAQLEQAGLVQGIITQNVDRLHQSAGSERVVELHGALADVRCLNCGTRTDRAALQRRLLQLNPDWHTRSAELAPDGDAEISPEATASFRVPSCRRCGGVLKPDVVFFGENVPKRRVDAAWDLFAEAEVLLVVGSSLTVYSGYRFVLRAKEEQVPVGIVNLGTTRGDACARIQIDGATGTVLPHLADALLSADRSSTASAAYGSAHPRA